MGNLTQYTAPRIRVCQAEDCSYLTLKIGNEGNPPWSLCTKVELKIVIDDMGIDTDYMDITTSVILAGTNTIYQTKDTNVINGTGTVFESELAEGDYIINSSAPFVLNEVYSITSDTELETSDILYDTILAPGSSFTIWRPNITIEPSALNLTTTTVPEGTYEIYLKFTINSTEYVSETSIVVDCSTYCCVQEKMIDLMDLDDNYRAPNNMNKILEALLMWGLYKSLDASALCNDPDKLAAIKNRLDDYCDQHNCKNC